MQLHWHAYSSIVSGSELLSGRQPECNPDNMQVFANSEQPPYMVWWWLLRPRRYVKATFDDVAAATKWLSEQYREIIAPSLSEQRLAEGMPLNDRLAYAERSLPASIDVVWGVWLPGARFVTLAIVACPNKFGDAPCPTGRQGSQVAAHAGR